MTEQDFSRRWLLQTTAFTGASAFGLLGCTAGQSGPGGGQDGTGAALRAIEGNQVVLDPAEWSDGKPFTADEVIFWREDVNLHPDLGGVGTAALRAGGKDVVVRKVDDLTVQGKAGEEPPKSLDLLKYAMNLYEEGLRSSARQRAALGKQIYQMHADQVWSIGVFGFGLIHSGMYYASNKLTNVPGRMVNSLTVRTPSNLLPMAFSYKRTVPSSRPKRSPC
jgi:hypothetical protein